jgi:hypothetical protein
VDLTATPPQLRDAFGNTDIAVLYDTNGDGLINTRDVPMPPILKTAGGATFTPGPEDLNLSEGIRAGVLFYSPGKPMIDGMALKREDAVFSWK